MERVGEGIEVLRLQATVHPHKTTNIYFLQDDDGVLVYETGSVGNADEIRRAAAERGGITRIVLSHAHADHRGGASQLAAPIFCHPAERPGAEGDGWLDGGYDLSKIEDPAVRAVVPRALHELDGGPLAIEDTVSGGDAVAGFEVIHLPGHTPGQIGLWRESDRVAIVSDAVFMWDPFTIDGLPGDVRLPPPAIRPDDQAARASVRHIAELEPTTVWLGHYGPITENVTEQLASAAAGD
jgi:glyoxylase-like metal-dependent hydrolase (beta-lactamase superfamily II)